MKTADLSFLISVPFSSKGQVDDQRAIKSELFEMLFILIFLMLTEFLFVLLEKYAPCNKMGKKGKS